MTSTLWDWNTATVYFIRVYFQKEKTVNKIQFSNIIFYCAFQLIELQLVCFSHNN